MPRARAVSRRSDCPRECGQRTNVLAKVDPRNDQIRALRDAMVVDGPDDGVCGIASDCLGRIPARRRRIGHRQCPRCHLRTSPALIGEGCHHGDLGVGEGGQCFHRRIDPRRPHAVVVGDQDLQGLGLLRRSFSGARDHTAQGEPGHRHKKASCDCAAVGASVHFPSPCPARYATAPELTVECSRVTREFSVASTSRPLGRILCHTQSVRPLGRQ